MAEVDSTEPRFDTVHGVKGYQEVNDLIAEPLAELIDAVQAGVYADHELDVDLLKSFHAAFLGGVMPDIAGKWRQGPVKVGNHEPPEYWDIDRLMREFFYHLRGRVEHTCNDPGDLQIETLAFAEASVLNIHPFADFNGRVARVLTLEMVRRFDLPLIRSWVEQGTPESAEYKAALVEFDHYRSTVPMVQFWLDHRFGEGHG